MTHLPQEPVVTQIETAIETFLKKQVLPWSAREMAEAIADHLSAARRGVDADGWREELRREIINTPETADFMAAVPLEAAHQRDRWGADHDAGKSPFDWFWLVGYLAQKAADAAVRGDEEKARHHTISTAAALANWHAALAGLDTRMVPGAPLPIQQQAETA